MTQDNAPEVPEVPAAEQPAGAPPVAPVQPRVDDSNMVTSYANYCRVMNTPEELSIDWAFNPQANPAEPVKISQRIIMNFYTAKRLLQLLSYSVQRHESFFGVLETDVQKRVRTR